jgi:hypothetical protein
VKCHAVEGNAIDLYGGLREIAGAGSGPSFGRLKGEFSLKLGLASSG